MQEFICPPFKAWSRQTYRIGHLMPPYLCIRLANSLSTTNESIIHRTIAYSRERLLQSTHKFSTLTANTLVLNIHLIPSLILPTILPISTVRRTLATHRIIHRKEKREPLPQIICMNQRRLEGQRIQSITHAIHTSAITSKFNVILTLVLTKIV